MSNLLVKIKNFFYLLPFGMKAADNEIMGSNSQSDLNPSSIVKEVDDERVAKHLLKGEVTREVEKLRYRTYKDYRESSKYDYIGNGVAVKKEEAKSSENDEEENAGIKKIKFTQENKLICNDILTELNRINDYGIEKYSIEIGYAYPVRLKFEPHLFAVDVEIKEGEYAYTTFRFYDTPNPSIFTSKPFIGELGKLYNAFGSELSYGFKNSEFSDCIACMDFVTLNASDEEPDIVSYSFLNAELIEVYHEKGEYKLVYKWDKFNRTDLTDKFYDAEMEELYKKVAKKKTLKETIVKEIGDVDTENITCEVCGKKIDVKKEGFLYDNEKGVICAKCYRKYLLSKKKS